MKIGQWVTVYNKSGYKKIIGYVERLTLDGAKLRITYPKRIFNKTVVVDEIFDDFKVEEIDTAILSDNDKKILIDTALILGDKEWFMELTNKERQK